MSYSKIPLILHFGNPDNLTLEESIPRTGNFAYYEKKASPKEAVSRGLVQQGL